MMIKLQAINTFLARLSKREKLVLYCAAVFVSLTLLDRLIISPIANKMDSLNKEIQERESGIRKNVRILAQKDRIVAETTEYSPYLGSLKVNDEEMTAILKEIETLASKSSVYLVDMKPSGAKGEAANKYVITLNCEAQMEQITEFMYNIESSNMLLTVEKYQIGPKTKASTIAKCSMTITKMVMQ